MIDNYWTGSFRKLMWLNLRLYPGVLLERMRNLTKLFSRKMVFCLRFEK